MKRRLVVFVVLAMFTVFGCQYEGWWFQDRGVTNKHWLPGPDTGTGSGPYLSMCYGRTSIVDGFDGIWTDMNKPAEAHIWADAGTGCERVCVTLAYRYYSTALTLRRGPVCSASQVVNMHAAVVGPPRTKVDGADYCIRNVWGWGTCWTVVNANPNNVPVRCPVTSGSVCG
jgi:hypothetical protein